MALKDLVADRSKLTEAAIEEIVSDYVRYDPSLYEVVLTPSGLALNNDAKVLVLLVAMSGWQFVVDEVKAIDTKPSALEQMTGIAGGTLRPILKKLKDMHLIVSTSDGYMVRVANLDAVGRVISGDKAVSKPATRKIKRARLDQSGASADIAEGGIEGKVSRSRRSAGVPIRSSLTRLLEAGFFSEAKSLSEVVERLHEMAIIAKTTSLSGPIADMVRNGDLSRKKVTEGGKEVWNYRSA